MRQRPFYGCVHCFREYKSLVKLSKQRTENVRQIKSQINDYEERFGELNFEFNAFVESYLAVHEKISNMVSVRFAHGSIDLGIEEEKIGEGGQTLLKCIQSPRLITSKKYPSIRLPQHPEVSGCNSELVCFS